MNSKKHPVLFPIVVLSITILALCGFAFVLASLVAQDENPKILGRLGTMMSLAFAAAMIKIVRLHTKMDDPKYLAKKYWKTLPDAEILLLSTFKDCLPNANCKDAMLKLIRTGKRNSSLNALHEEINLPSWIIWECAAEATYSLNLEYLKYLIDSKFLDPKDTLDGDNNNFAHLLAYGYEDQATKDEYLEMAIYLRKIGLNFKKKNSQFDTQTPIEIIQESESSPDVVTTLKLAEVFDPEISNAEIIRKYCKEEPKETP